MATTNLTNLKANVLTDVVSTILSTAGVSSVPKITTITYPGDDTAADTGGGQTISISGSGFNIGASVIINGTVASVVTVVSATSLTFTAPAQSAGTYTFYVVNTDGGTAIAVPGISYSGTPSWSTSAGSLGTSYETNAVSNTVTATGDATISYSLFSGTLPTGSSLNTSTGAITGTSAALNSPTTYSFVIRATDGQNQDTDRSFSITINPDAVTWISPADNSTTTAYEYSPISNVTMSATSAAGKSITFTANSLPTGVTITSNTISGTPTVVANTNTRLTANSSNTFKTATKDINFVVNPDVVTWSSPADGTSTALFQNQAMSNVTLSATSAAGKSITYTANTLPTGVTITGAVVNGTPTVDGTTNSLITATATTTNRTATRNFTWVVSVANETYFKNTTLLLNGETTVTPFISDASTNGFGLTIAGDTKPVLFNPYQDGYYSNFFDGTGDYLTLADNTALQFGTGDFTVELWWYPTSVASDQAFLGSSAAGGYDFVWRTSTGLNIGRINTAFDNTFSFTPTVNQWYHIAYSRSGTSLKVFVNGSQVGSTATNSISYVPGGSAVIGGSTTVDRLLTGYISNFRIVKGTAVYTSAFTPSTTPLTAIANTSLLTCQSNRFIDKSTNAFTITKNGDTTISPNIPFTANSSYSTYGSAYFDGTGDYLSAPSNSAFAFGTGDFTVEGWYYSTAGNGRFNLYDSGSGGANGQLSIFQDTVSSFYVRMGGDITYASPPGNNQWVHFAVTRSGTTVRLFFNGILAVSGTQSTNITNNTPYIGLLNGYGYPMNGYISDLRVVKGTALYTTAFTPPTTPLTAIANTSLLTLQYNGGATNQGIIDNSNFNNIVTRNGNASQGSFSPYSQTGWSNYFDGSGDTLTIPSPTTGFSLGTGEFTIEMWVYKTSAVNCVLLDARSAAAGLPWVIAIDASNFPYLYDNTVYASTVAVTLNSWSHVAVVRTSGVLKIFVNGVQGYSASYSANLDRTSGLVIGDTVHAAAPMLGYISNLRIVKGTAVYTTAFTPPTSPLTAIANTSLLTCQSNRFIDNSPSSLAITKAGDVSVQAISPFGSIREATPLSYSSYFDGTGDYLTVPDNVVLQLGSGDFTVEFWINYNSITGYQSPFTKGYTAAGDILLQTGNGNGALIVYLSGSAVITESTGANIGQWYHYALVRSGTTVTLYRDGVSRGTATSSVNFNTTNQLAIGATGKAPTGGSIGMYSINGYMSNFRLVKNTAVYTSAFTPATTPLTAISGTQLLTCQSTTMIDNSTNAFTITAVGDTKPRQFNPFGYTAQSATSYTPSLHGGSMYLDGTGDYLVCPAIANISGTGYSWTVQGWFYPSAVDVTRGIIDGWNGGAGTSLLVRINAGYLECYVTGGSSTQTAASAIVANQWYHFALVKDVNNSNTVQLYLNGVKVGTPIANYTTSVTSNIFGIGGNTSTGGEPFKGYLSDIQIIKGTAVYTSAFVPPTQTIGNYSTTYPSSLLLNFNNGGIIDQHSTNVLETVGNAQLSTAVKKYNNASMYFDGTGDYLNIPYSQSFNFGTGDFTVEGWIYLNSLASSYYVMAGTYTTGTTDEWLIQISNGNTIRFLTSVGTSFYSATITTSTWYHIAAVRNGSTITLYVNGTSVGSYTNSNSIGSVSKVLYIGVQNISTWPMNGYIDDLRITKFARYTSNFTAPTSALITK